MIPPGSIGSIPIDANGILHVLARDVKTGATVWNHYYTHDEPVSGKDVPAIVVALDMNVERQYNL